MNITNKDLELLIWLENKMGCSEGWTDEVMELWKLIEKLQRQRDQQRQKTRIAIADGRKIDKNYGRSKK